MKEKRKWDVPWANKETPRGRTVSRSSKSEREGKPLDQPTSKSFIGSSEDVIPDNTGEQRGPR